MFDIGGTELLVIGVVALVVVGPKDLPGMFRTVGRFTAKARAMGREFSRAMEDAAKESGVDEVTKDLKAMTSKKNLGLDALEGAAAKFEKWDPLKPSTTAKGPATQALADKKVATEKPEPKTKAKSTAKPKSAAKTATKPKAAPKAQAAAKPKTPRKPAAGKPAK